MRLRNAFTMVACTVLLGTAAVAQSGQMDGMPMAQGGQKKPLLSPAATASVTLAGSTVMIKYNAPSLRGRHVGGAEIVPYGQVWRTGANPATTMVTPVALHIGSLLVPAGTYTIYTMPIEHHWKLIVNKQNGQWGTEYHAEQDLGRVDLIERTLDSPQEVMSISFDEIKKDSAVMHIRWEKFDEAVKVSTP